VLARRQRDGDDTGGDEDGAAESPTTGGHISRDAPRLLEGAMKSHTVTSSPIRVETSGDRVIRVIACHGALTVF
jgi:hypothetical protein